MVGQNRPKSPLYLYNMDHMRISGTEPSSVILSQTMKSKKLKSDDPKVPKQAKATRDGAINPQHHNLNQPQHGKPGINAFQVVSFTRKKRHFQPSVKKWEIIKRHQSNNFYLKIYLNSIQLCTLIYWLNAKSSTSSKKKIAGRFRLPPQPNGAMQNYLMLRPGYRSVNFLDTMCTVGILRMFCHSICADFFVNTEFYVSRKRTTMTMCSTSMNG